MVSSQNMGMVARQLRRPVCVAGHQSRRRNGGGAAATFFLPTTPSSSSLLKSDVLLKPSFSSYTTMATICSSEKSRTTTFSKRSASELKTSVVPLSAAADRAYSDTGSTTRQSNSLFSSMEMTTAAKAALDSSMIQDSDDDSSDSLPPSASIFAGSKNPKLNLLLHVDMEELHQMASKRCTPLSLKDMYKYAVKDVDNPEQRMWNAQFLHRELPIRMAQRAYDLLTLPHGLNETPAILQVAHVYLLYLKQFQECPMPNSVETEKQFTNMLQHMILERASIPNAIAKGIDAWQASRQTLQQSHDNDDDSAVLEEQIIQDMEDALYRFFTARVGLRFLTQHHIMSNPKRLEELKDQDDKDFFLGCIQTNCEPIHEVHKVVKYVQKQTEDYYGTCPEIQIIDATSPPGDDDDTQHVNFTYVPHHLRYMVSELLKNSCRATVKRHIESCADGTMPSIRIVVVKGKEDVTIKIADRGGGIPRSKMSQIWQFAHSTAARDENETDFGVDEFTGAKIRGFGLPLARIYARYLGGELTLKSLEGYGVDAYLHLPRLGDACENLPLQVQFSPSNLNSNAPKRAVV